MQVISITECEFDGVPKKHHINCGLSVASHNITLNLLAEVSHVSGSVYTHLRVRGCGCVHTFDMHICIVHCVM